MEPAFGVIEEVPPEQGDDVCILPCKLMGPY